ncbi:tyrosine-protein phosphatase siw14 [Physocladia obscura]|uniref:Tyrosine-protein phosphatase siw14 n=1 Tax=Physocladia obscura TaxID=109957 RepID=A0AAD5XJQ5_9FUNG|nr:tyrosine-protein phosphatase siw14 [Physocladia obscura]
MMTAIFGDAEEEKLYPMENFSLVVNGVYRSAFPKKKNFSFLKRLKLKSILTLILEDYPEQNQKFLDTNNITLFQFGVAGNKDLMDIPENVIYEALSVILDKRNHPRKFQIMSDFFIIAEYKNQFLSIATRENIEQGVLWVAFAKFNTGHCTKPFFQPFIRELTVRAKPSTSIFEEYRRFSHPKSRTMDQQFIELFVLRNVVADPRHLPDWPEIQWKEGMIATMLVDGGLKGLSELMREIAPIVAEKYGKEKFTDVHEFVTVVQDIFFTLPLDGLK